MRFTKHIFGKKFVNNFMSNDTKPFCLDIASLRNKMYLFIIIIML